MSVVAGKVYEDYILVAADSIRVRGYSKRTDGDFSKLIKVNGMILGGCGFADETSLLWQYSHTHKPLAPTAKDVSAFFVEFMRWKMDLIGVATMQNTYLLAYEGHLFEVEKGTFVFEVNDYTAIGAGQDFANAALYLGKSPKEAVKVACELSCFVSEPIVFEEMAKT